LTEFRQNLTNLTAKLWAVSRLGLDWCPGRCKRKPQLVLLAI
jgi:hypothetical protein